MFNKKKHKRYWTDFDPYEKNSKCEGAKENWYVIQTEQH